MAAEHHLRPAGEGGKGREIVVPIQRSRNGDMLVEVIFNDHLYARMMIDTGSSVTKINVRFLHKLSLPEQAIVLRGKARTASGIVDTYGVIINKVAVDTAVKTDMLVLFADEKYDVEEYDGLLGMNFLADFIFTIDYHFNRLYLKRR
ncbi:MAG: retropepsin-like aspartic protease [Syntrophales bacterium]|nr:retropepsin-like aspartic protease [Syntrophales bacterium]